MVCIYYSDKSGKNRSGRIQCKSSKYATDTYLTVGVIVDSESESKPVVKQPQPISIANSMTSRTSYLAPDLSPAGDAIARRGRARRIDEMTEKRIVSVDQLSMMVKSDRNAAAL